MTIKFEYKYDAWNRLVQVLLPVVSSTNPYVQYEYDGLNRLIVRQADPGADGTIDETRQFYYTQEWQVIEEQVGATASTARPDVQYVWGTQYVDDLVVRYRDADASGSSGSPSLEEELYSLADANFNVTAVTENDGDVVERFTYTPYGVSTALDPDFTSYTGADYNWTYRYTTRELDLLTGLQLNRERWYTNLLGRWMNRDPIGYTGGSYNLYEYVNGMPLDGLDPSGTDFFTDRCLDRCDLMKDAKDAASCATLCHAIDKLAKKCGINKCEALRRICAAIKNQRARAACELAYTALCPRG